MLRTGHGNGAGQPRIEVAPIDELPEGLPAPTGYGSPALPVGDRLPTGQLVAGSATAIEMARRGGLAKAAKERGRVRILECLGLVDLPADVAIHPYLIQAEEFAKAEVARLAAEVGGGHCPINAASLVQSAALQLASSRYLFAKAEGDAGKLQAAGKLADSSRQNLLAAHELAARTAITRAKQPGGLSATDQSIREIMDAE